jgi:D-glycero-beta-D-manno-heptose-7-phosphate kinase
MAAAPRTSSAAATSRFADYRERVAHARVLVVGDVMLDRYWFGEVDRISPEAPVPVVKIARSEERPGGAANVARNAAALGAEVALLSVTGADEAGTALERLLALDRVRTYFHRDPTLATTVKLRVIGRQQQLLRIDFETAPSHEVLAGKLVDYDRLLADNDVVVLSDYGKGGLAHIATMIERARAAGKPVLVDPKGEDWTRYRGATLVTPNRGEFREVAGRWRDEADMTARALALCAELEVGALLVTRSEEGMSLYTAAGADHIPAVAREVFDVSGAGDTVIATLGVLLGAGTALPAAVRIANEAAGVVVGKLGTAVVTPDELS